MQSVQSRQMTIAGSEVQSDTSIPVSSKLINYLPHLGFLLGIIMWTIDAAVDTFFLHPDEEFWTSMFAEKPTEMWMRTLVIIVSTVASLLVQHFMRKQYKFEMLLLEQQARLEHLVHERTQELQHLANFDPLTHIYNRRKFREILDSEIKRAKRYNQPLSLVLLDIDHFKTVNDDYGHSEGDKVLESIAEILRNHLRKSDYYARWGGEEFIILMTHTDVQTAAQVAEKLGKLLGSIKYGNNITISASFGVSCIQADEDINPLIKRTDDALYDAKHDGRNCVRAR